MAGASKREIRDQGLQGLKCRQKIRPFDSRLRKVGTERDRAGNCRLIMDQYCSMITCMLILIDTVEKPNRVMDQMVWYELIGTRISLLRSPGLNSARGCPSPRAGVDGKRSPEGESADVSERVEVRMTGASVRREGVGSPEPVRVQAPSLARLGLPWSGDA